MRNFTIVVITLIALIGGYYIYRGRTTPTPASAPETTAPLPAAVTGQTHEVVMDASGFVPADLMIKAGDTVVFVNRDTRSRWPASGLHPTHLLCPGFDALQPLAANENYSHTFTEAKECPMHDHLIPSIRGKITVAQ